MSAQPRGPALLDPARVQGAERNLFEHILAHPCEPTPADWRRLHGACTALLQALNIQHARTADREREIVALLEGYGVDTLVAAPRSTARKPAPRRGFSRQAVLV